MIKKPLNEKNIKTASFPLKKIEKLLKYGKPLFLQYSGKWYKITNKAKKKRNEVKFGN